MRHILFALVLSLLLTVSCRRPPPVKAPPPAAKDTRNRLPYYTAVLHVDVDFTPEERAHIRNAATAWFILSQGRAKILTVEDLDFSHPETLDPSLHRIVKIEAASLPIGVGRPNPLARVMAFTYIPVNPWEARGIYMVYDRIQPDAFMWVAAHEMGHLLGLDDLDTRGDVMSGVGTFKQGWFTVADLRECQAAGACP